MKKIVLRKCIATNSLHPVKELLRVNKDKNGLISFDKEGNMLGRGAYIYRSEEAVLLAKKKKVFNRAFKTDVDDSLYEILLNEVRKG